MKADTRSFYESAIRKAVERIAGGLDDALDLDALARQAALSPLHFHHVFRGMVGETPLEMHRRLRLERAAWQLLRVDEGVTHVAFAAGYETHEAFTRAFRRAHGVPPSGFRTRETGCAEPRWELATRNGVHFAPGGTRIELHFSLGEGIMNIELREVAAKRLATIRHIGPYPQIGAAFERLGMLAGPAGLFGPGVEMIALYHDDPEGKPAAELRSDAALSVPDERPLPEGLVEVRIPAGRYAMGKHVGPYTGLGDAWARLMGEWLPKSGHRIREDGASFELYRNTPMDTPQDKLVTELYVPIE